MMRTSFVLEIVRKAQTEVGNIGRKLLEVTINGSDPCTYGTAIQSRLVVNARTLSVLVGNYDSRNIGKHNSRMTTLDSKAIVEHPAQHFGKLSTPATHLCISQTSSLRQHHAWDYKQMSSASSSKLAEEVVDKISKAASPSDLEDVTPLLEKLPASALAGVAEAAASSKVRHRNFGQTLAEMAVDALPSISPADITSLVVSMSNLGVYSVAFKDAATDQVLARIKDFTGTELCHTVQALAASSYYNADLLDSLADLIADKGSELDLTARDVANVAYAYDKAGWCHEEIANLVERTADKVVAGLNSGSSSDEAEHKKSIPFILDALARVGCCEATDAELVEALLSRAVEDAASFDGYALSSIVVAATRLGVSDERFLHPFLDAMIEKKDDVTPKNFVRAVKALGELGLRHVQFLDTLTEDIVPSRLREFSPEGLSDLLVALNKLNYYSEEFLDLVQSQNNNSDKNQQEESIKK